MLFPENKADRWATVEPSTDPYIIYYVWRVQSNTEGTTTNGEMSGPVRGRFFKR